MEITVVLTNYLRQTNMPAILAALAAQTVPHRLFAWDNSPDQSFEARQADWIVRSSLNAKCGARWWLAAHADTPWVVVLDDDLLPADERVLADTLAKLVEHRSAIGATGVILDPQKTYAECQHVGLGVKPITVDTRVDIVKGRYLAVATEKLRPLPYMPLECDDDIILSAALGGGVIAESLQQRFRELPTGPEARVQRPTHSQSRETSRRQYLCTPSGS
jgi:hypothetical protein